MSIWQRNYYEHIIRNETEMTKIREYIINNPLGWESDENYKAWANPALVRPAVSQARKGTE